jgi:F-type H+-transporting ATPase subunit b
MPQIAQIAATYASQAFWLLLVFGIIYFVIAKGMLGKIGETVEARAKKVADDLASAERARAQADKAEADYAASVSAARQNAAKLANDAKSSAAAHTDAKVKAADAQLAVKLADAEARIGAARASALSGVQTVASEAATDIIRKLTGAGAAAADVEAAVAAAMRR